jgi:hypothetical protein
LGNDPTLDRQRAVAFEALGSSLTEQGQLPAAEDAYNRAGVLYEKAFGPNHPETARALHRLKAFRKERSHSH